MKTSARICTLALLTSASLSTLAQPDRNLTAHGFVSFGASQLSEDSYINDFGDETTISYETGQQSDASIFGNTWAGFQINAPLFKYTDFIYQVIIEADDSASNDFETRTEWMYLKHELGAGFNTQIGRIRLPAFMDSEVRYVAQTYPWVTAPSEIYSLLPVNHIDGVSLNHHAELGDWSIDSKAILWGESKDDSDTYSLSLDNTYGLAVDATYESLQIHAAVLATTELIDINLPSGTVKSLPDGVTASFEDELLFYVLGARFDDGQAYASAEYVQVETDKGLVDETEAYNITLGWYFGDFLPYISLSSTDTTNSDDIAGNIDDELGSSFNVALGANHPNNPTSNTLPIGPRPVGTIAAPFFIKKQSNTSLGVKYNLTPAVSLKAQVQKVDGFDGTGGKFDDPSLPYDEIIIYDLAIQAAF